MTPDQTDNTQILLQHAKTKHIISEAQYSQLIALNNDLFHNLSKQQNNRAQQNNRTQNDTPKFVLSHLLYYSGGLIAIGAMSLFMTLGFEQYGGAGMMIICLLYAIFGSAIARLLYQKNLLMPYSIVLGFLLCLVPLFIFALQKTLDVWQDYSHYQDYHHWISAQWLSMELGTLLVGAVMIYYFRRSFVMLPIAVTLWFLSMDILPLITHSREWYDWEMRRIISLYFGIGMTILAMWIDYRQSRDGQDFAFWLYIVGVMTFWGGLSLQDSDSELSKFIYYMINISMMIVGVILRRRVFAVFGGLGVGGYLSHLAYRVFADSLIFPLILTAIGFAVIALGILWQRHERALYTRALRHLPHGIRQKLLQLYQ